MSQCTAKTTKGRRCKQKAVEGFEYCRRHKEIHVDLVAEMEAMRAERRANEEKMKRQINMLKNLLQEAEEKVKIDAAARRELALHRARTPRRRTQEGGSEAIDGDDYRWLALGLLAVGVGVMWWRRTPHK